ncbi:MAG: capsular polysaccharide biosynthesis protein [Pseudomonadota bacterium]
MASEPEELFVYNGGLLAKGRVRRILELAGYAIRLGKPGADDAVGVWGRSPTAPRGETVASWTGSRVVRVEDTFLRSLFTGRSGDPPLGLMIDDLGVHFDSNEPSRLETILAKSPLDDTALLDRAREGMRHMAASHLSKYAACDPGLPVPDAGFVLVVDQTRDDASIAWGGSNATTFREMLVHAQTEHPDKRIVIKTHPETQAGHRPGYFDAEAETDRISHLSAPVSPWALFDHAAAVYTVSSGLGFEAILAGHTPRVFGQPWYAGWGLTKDENPVARRERRLTRSQLFAAAMILAPTWYDPFNDRLCEFESALATLEVMARAWREDRRGWVATGMSRWKHPHIARFIGSHGAVRFVANPAKAVQTAKSEDRPLVAWATRMADDLPLSARVAGVTLWRMEDGLLRSKGLGADLVPALSLILDDLGIGYDALSESRLERLIAEATNLPPLALARAARLRRHIVSSGLSKYNTGKGTPLLWPDTPGRPRKVLVAGQVEDDASVLKGSPRIRTNLGLLRAARAAHPDALIAYKPHPDVEAGLRTGAVEAADVDGLADLVCHGADPSTALSEADGLWTLTSTLGFEALLRGVPVTCLGAPFYAGWGLTDDKGPVPGRRTARPCLDALVHAVLIDYPRYRDPATGLPCPPEICVGRLENMGDGDLSLMARLQRRWRRLKRRR